MSHPFSFLGTYLLHFYELRGSLDIFFFGILFVFLNFLGTSYFGILIVMQDFFGGLVFNMLFYFLEFYGVCSFQVPVTLQDFPDTLLSDMQYFMFDFHILFFHCFTDSFLSSYLFSTACLFFSGFSRHFLV